MRFKPGDRVIVMNEDNNIVETVKIICLSDEVCIATPEGEVVNQVYELSRLRYITKLDIALK